VTVRSTCYGHDAVFDEAAKVWRYASDGTTVSTARLCQGCGVESAVLNLGGQPVDVDACIAPIVQALNDGGCPTVASCCGHRRRHGRISLRDGRELFVLPDFDTATALDQSLGLPPINPLPEVEERP
jgi:hypothetical protein